MAFTFLWFRERHGRNRRVGDRGGRYIRKFFWRAEQVAHCVEAGALLTIRSYNSPRRVIGARLEQHVFVPVPFVEGLYRGLADELGALPRRVEIHDVFDVRLAALFGGRFFEGDAGIEVFGACFAGGVMAFAFAGLAGHEVAVGSTFPPSLSRAPL